MPNVLSDSVSTSTPTHGLIVALITACDADRFIAGVVLKARRYVDRVIVVDAGSKDLTADLSKESGAEVIRHEQNQGKTGAVNTGVAHVRSLNVAAVVFLDGDDQHDPADIPALIAPILAGQADLIIGSRFTGMKSNTSRWRLFGQQALTTASNTNSQTGYRALSARAIAEMDPGTTSFSVESEMQLLIKQHNLTVAEVPMQAKYDERLKRNPFKHGVQGLNGIIRMVSQNRPLFFFSIPGLCVMLIGVLLAVLVVDRYNAYEKLAIGTAIISMSLITLGALTAFTGLILHTIRAYLE